MGSWLDELNSAQREAVAHGAGPLLIVAGAGTGKTRTLACRVAYLIQQGVPAERILLLTFTRRAAAEMLQRAAQVTGEMATGKVWGGTFHAIGNRLLRMYGRSVGLPPDFTVMDEGDAADLMNLIRGELGLAKQGRRFPQKQTLLSIYSRMVNAQEQLTSTLATYFPWCQENIEEMRAIFEAYTQRKRERHLLDYDDLLLFWSALCASPQAGSALADRFEHILVDEYQDTNALQAEILCGMRKRRSDICVVGDDAQSIYSFRAATVRNILDFPRHFPGARIVTLEKNYRSTQPILAASNAVMDQARERYTKNLWSDRESRCKPVLVTCLDENQQCELVCRNILDHLEQHTALMQQAVLFRASHHSAMLEIELARRNIPFRKYGGLKFVEAAHIKDMLALLRIVENPFDEISWFRVLQLLEGIGPRIARRIIDELGVRGPTPPQGADGAGEETKLPGPLALLAARPPNVPPAARGQFAELRALLAECAGIAIRPSSADAAPPAPGPMKAPPLPVQIERIRRFYEPIFERIFDNPIIRLRDLEQLSQIATGYRSRHRFITDLTLDPPSSTSDLAGPPFLEEDWLTLSTIHSAKGCEWTAVHIIHAADGMIPSDMALTEEAGVDEERRLFYVAMTRAKDALYVYFPLRYYHRRFGQSDTHGYGQLTRFVSDDVRRHFECRTAYADEESERPASEDTGDGTEHAPPQINPYSRVKRLWQE